MNVITSHLSELESNYITTLLYESDGGSAAMGWGGVEQPRKVENKSSSCILNQLQRTIGALARSEFR